MKTLANTFLSMVDRFMTKISPLNTLIDHTVAWIAPRAVATACSGYYCQTGCDWVSGTPCYNTLGCPCLVDFYASGPPQCESGAFNCSVPENGGRNCCGGSYCG